MDSSSFVDVKEIKNYEGYYITDNGHILNKDRRVLRTPISPRGFKRITIQKDNKRKVLSVHKLVAQAFIEPYEYDIPGSILKFKDNDKLNTSKDNLYWVSKSSLSKNKVCVLTYDNKDYHELDYLPKELMKLFINNGDLRAIKNSPGSYIHRDGFVVGEEGNIRATFLSQDGYKRVGKMLSLEHGGKRVNRTIHLLVVEGFLEPYTYRNGDKTVNHIDGNRVNNHADNLEWVSVKANINHAHNMGLVKTNAKIELTDLKEGAVTVHRSLRELSRYLKLPLAILISKVAPSEKYPIFGRFKIKVINKDTFLSTNKDRSKKVYLYDFVTKEYKEFTSVGKLCLMYGIVPRRIHRAIKRDGFVYVSGCAISSKPLNTFSNIESYRTVEAAKQDRENEWSNSILVKKK